MGNSPDHASSVCIIRNFNTGYISPQLYVIYASKFQTVSGVYEDNEAVASHIRDSLAQDQRENILTEAESEQEPLP